MNLGADAPHSYATLAAFLSVGIGLVNLLPIPVLDGGHLLFYAYEAVARGHWRPRLRRRATGSGLLCWSD